MENNVHIHEEPIKILRDLLQEFKVFRLQFNYLHN